MKENNWKKGIRLVAVFGVLLLIGGLVAASTVPQPDKNKGPEFKTIKKASIDLENQLAVNEIDNKMGDSIPTFGGMYVDEAQSTIYVYVKNQRDAEKVEKIISPYKSEINLKILQGKYTLWSEPLLAYNKLRNFCCCSF